MRIAIGCDHGGFLAKEEIKKYLESEFGYQVFDFGCFSSESCNYPYYAFQAAEAVASGKADKGILICNSGEGVAMCANKVKGIRCGIGYNDDVSHLIVEHNHANMIAFGAQFTSLEEMKRRIKLFFSANVLEGRHEIRVNLIKKYEETGKICDQ